MLGWAIGFFLAAVVAAVFGFGGIASAFTGIAIILFWVFLALFVLSLIFGGFRGAHVEGHPSRFSGLGGAGVVALIAIVAIAVYAWTDNGMSAERAGRVIDRETAQLAEAASETLSQAGERTENLIEDASTEIREDASQGLDEPSDNVDPERERE